MTLDEALQTVRESVRAAADAIRDLPDEKLIEMALIAARATGAPQQHAIADTDPADAAPGHTRTIEFSSTADAAVRESLAPVERKLMGFVDGHTSTGKPTAALRAEQTTKEVGEAAPRPTATAAAKKKVLALLASGPKTRPELQPHISSSGTLQHALTELALEGSVRRPATKRAPWSLA